MENVNILQEGELFFLADMFLRTLKGKYWIRTKVSKVSSIKEIKTSMRNENKTYILSYFTKTILSEE